MRFQCSECHGIVAIDDADYGEPVGCGHCGAVVTVPKSRFAPGVMINDFIIRDTLGHGGMGTVYLAHQFSLDRPVALKILMEQFSTNSEFIVDFVKEARAAASLNHPNIVQSYAVGEEDGIYFFAMEYVEGKTLKQMMDAEGQLPMDRALNIIQQIAEALDFAWKQKQLVHRDIKPDNIMLTHRGVAKLADLGLARMAHETLDDDDDLVMGTPQYICPEQLLGQPMDVRGDVYSLGATLFHALTGDFPFDGNGASEIARKHLQEALPDPKSINPDLPDTVCWVLRKMMAKKIEDRYEDAHELAIDLGYILKGEKPVGYSDEDAAPAGGDSRPKPRPKTKTKGKVKLSGGPVKSKPKLKTGTASTAGAAKAAGGPPALVTSDHSTSTAIPKPKPKSADADSADSTEEEVDDTPRTRIKITSQKSGKSKTFPVNGTQPAAAPAATAARVGPAGVPAQKEKKSGNMIVMGGIAVFVFLVIGGIALIGWIIAVKGKYDPANEAELLALYWSLDSTTEQEKVDFENVETMFGQAESLKNNPSQLQENATALRDFSRTYTESLFVKDPDQFDYKEVFQPKMGGGQNLHIRAADLAGIVPKELTKYNRHLLDQAREQAVEEAEAEIVERTKEAGDQAITDTAVAAARAAAETRKKEIQEQFAKYREMVAFKKTEFEEEKKALRRKFLEYGFRLDFGLAINSLETNRGNILRYRGKVEDVVDVWKRSEAINAREIPNQVIADFPRADAGAIRDAYREAETELEIRVLLNEDDQIVQEDNAVLAQRDAWIDKHIEGLRNAQAYVECFEKGKETLVGSRYDEMRPALGFRTRSIKVKVSDVKGENITLQAFEINPSTFKEEVKATRTFNIREIPDNERSAMAKVAWGALNTTELAVNEVCFLAYSAEPGKKEAISNAIDMSGYEHGSFLKEELDEFEKIANDLFYKGLYERVKQRVDAGKVQEAQSLFNKAVDTFGDDELFQSWKDKMLEILP